MFLCGRALLLIQCRINLCRNKSLATDPTPGVYSWRRRAEIVPAPLLARVESGRVQVQHPVWGFLRLFLSPALPVPHLVWQREQLVAVTVSRFGSEREICNFMAQSSSLRRWEGSKVTAMTDIPKWEVLGWKLYRPNRWSWIVTALCVVVGNEE